MAQQESVASLTVRHRFSTSSSAFLTQLGATVGGGCVGEQEMDVIMLDHCYAKPWSAHPDASSARPVRMLFMPKQIRTSTLEMLQRNVDPPIDVVDAPPAPSMPFDINKARNLMTECERHASYGRTDSQEDWEEKISKSGWTIQQTRLFNKVTKILQSDRLARLAMESVVNEPIARRQVVDMTAKRMRHAFATVGWDTDLVQWLHQLILDTVSVHLLASYLDALQTLKAKIPPLVDKMVAGALPKHPSLSHESLGLLLKRPWDPIGNALTQQKLKKLPGNPLLLIAPSGPSQSGGSHTGHAKRLKFWQVHLNSLGKTILTNMSGGSGVSVVLCLEQMIGALRTKVLEQKSHHPGRPIILVGWNIGALVACHVSLVESVNAVVCLGFPFTGIHGPRGDCEDPLLGSQTPTLFVIGQNASDCFIDQLQDLREHMRAETGMLVVGGADEQLRLSHRQKREEGLTQAMADRCIIDEVYQFLGSILSMNAGLPDLPPADFAQADLRKKRKRKLPRDLMAIMPTENTVTTAVGQSSAVSTPPALVSGTGRVSKRGGKAARMMAASGGAAVTAERGRPAPRKRQARGGMGPGARKRMTLGLSHLGVHTTRSTASLQSTNTATLSAISNAPELSGLLQGIRVSRPSEGDSVVVGGARSLMGTPFPLTKVLTFSKLMEGGDAGTAGSTSGPATLLASAVKSGDAAEKDKTQPQQQQFLVKTGGSTGSPLAIPISMAQRLMARGTSPLVHITGTGSSNSSQIHQLLTSIARNSSSTPSPHTQPQTALLINTTSTASSLSPASLTAQAGSREKAGPGGKAETAELGIASLPGEQDGGKVRSDGSQDTVSASRLSANDFATATVSLASSAAALTQTSQKSQAAVGEATTVLTPVTQSKQKSVTSAITTLPLQTVLSNPASVAKQASLTSLPTPGQQVSLSKTAIAKSLSALPHHTSLITQASLTSSATETIQSKLESAASGQPSALMKSGFVQLAVTKSLINSSASTSHSILGKVVASSITQAGRAGSPTATSSILGGRNAVLISPAIAKSLTSTPTAILLSKTGSSSGAVSAAYKPTVEMLGKVSSVLESGVKGRQAGLTCAGSPSLVSVPFCVSKSSVMSALSVSKASGLAASQTPPCPVCVASAGTVTAAPAATTSAGTATTSSTSGGGGRASHKSSSAVSYTASSKPVLPTATSTRTRKIKTPRQYDL